MAISIKLKIPLKRGPGFWKLNHSYLDDPEYRSLVLETFKQCNKSNMTKWEIFKHEVKIMSIKFSKKKSRERYNKLQFLEKRLRQLYERNLDSNSSTINIIENEIQSIYEIKAHGAQVRSRVQILEEGEKSTKLFLNLEKSRQNRKTITSLNINNKRINDSNQILNEEVKIYTSLYTSNRTEENHIEYINDINVHHTLTNSEANICESPFSIKECLLAIKSMKKKIKSRIR